MLRLPCWIAVFSAFACQAPSGRERDAGSLDFAAVGASGSRSSAVPGGGVFASSRSGAAGGPSSTLPGATTRIAPRLPPEPPPRGPSDFTSNQCERVDGPGFGCPGYRWVGRVSEGGDCPVPDDAHWELTRPFADEAGFLGELCNYEWAGLEQQPEPPFAELNDGTSELPGDLIAVAKDCQALAKADRACVPSSEEEDVYCAQTQFAQAMEEQYLRAVDAPSWSAESAGEFAQAPVILAAIDAAPRKTTGPLPGRLQHGNFTKRIAELLGCSGATCVFERRFYTALYPTTGRDVAGSAFDAARAAYAALGQASSAGAALVLEFGLGFHQAGNCDDDTLTVRALREVVQLATCEHDAIVLAPVGNRVPDEAEGSEEAGVMHPAAWQNQTCGEGSDLPLVTAVSAVDLQGSVLPSALTDGLEQAPLFAPGGPVAFDTPDGLLPLRDGTSIATASAGAVAALLRAARPDLDAAALLRVLAEAEVPVGKHSARVVTACGVLRAACATKAACVALESLCPASEPFANGDALSGALSDLPALSQDGSVASTSGCPRFAPNPGDTTPPLALPGSLQSNSGGGDPPLGPGVLTAGADPIFEAGSFGFGSNPAQQIDACVTSGERGGPGVPNGIVIDDSVVIWSLKSTIADTLTLKLLVNASQAGSVSLPTDAVIAFQTPGTVSLNIQSLSPNDALGQILSAQAEWQAGEADAVILDLPVYQP